MKKLLFTLGLVGVMGFVSITAEAVDAAGTYKRNCAGCHGVDGAKKTGEGTIQLKGLQANQLNELLDGYKNGNGGPRKMVMENVLKRLSDEDRATIVEYISTSLK